MSEAKKKSMWWEKTVEYAFVLRLMKDLSNAFPLAGNPETWFGDLLVQNGNKFRLIEFKARECNIQDEKWKWKFFEEQGNECTVKLQEGSFHTLLAEEISELTEGEKIVDLPGHKAHWFIYGEERSDAGFDLIAQGYSKDKNDAVPIPSKEALDALDSVEYQDMLSYLTELKAARGGAGTSGGLVIVGVQGGDSFALTTQQFLRGDAPQYREAHAIRLNEESVEIKRSIPRPRM